MWKYHTGTLKVYLFSSGIKILEKNQKALRACSDLVDTGIDTSASESHLTKQ